MKSTSRRGGNFKEVKGRHWGKSAAEIRDPNKQSAEETAAPNHFQYARPPHRHPQGSPSAI
ncbi:hypothetical protein Bca4012_055955 [Brassica carinata]|uniref:Uncharacterized protein n=1 Tax=Brassica carinata TaxID=52824 RepID=A0A8X7VZR8_BRACI|nr:hypothetical protein Bca52824_014242 [Brassica carinata]